MPFSRKKILQALRQVRHPAEGKDVVKLNMIEDLTVEGNTITFLQRLMKIRLPEKHFSNSRKNLNIQ